MTEKSDSITIKKDDLWKYSTFALLAILVVGAFVVFTTGGSSSPTGLAVDNPTVVPGEPSRVEASIDDDPILGDPNAPVTIIEFSDYECPFCARFWSQTLPLIKSEYIDTGKVRLVYRDFPLTSIHPMALPAAEAAECVQEQYGDEAYYEYHDVLFANYQFLSVDSMKQWAQELGYDISDCLDSGQMRSEVQKDLADGQSYGVTGTPGFIINGKLLSGAQPFPAFQQAIEAEL